MGDSISPFSILYEINSNNKNIEDFKSNLNNNIKILIEEIDELQIYVRYLNLIYFYNNELLRMENFKRPRNLKEIKQLFLTLETLNLFEINSNNLSESYNFNIQIKFLDVLNISKNEIQKISDEIFNEKSKRKKQLSKSNSLENTIENQSNSITYKSWQIELLENIKKLNYIRHLDLAINQFFQLKFNSNSDQYKLLYIVYINNYEYRFKLDSKNNTKTFMFNIISIFNNELFKSLKSNFPKIVIDIFVSKSNESLNLYNSDYISTQFNVNAIPNLFINNPIEKLSTLNSKQYKFSNYKNLNFIGDQINQNGFSDELQIKYEENKYEILIEGKLGTTKYRNKIRPNKICKRIECILIEKYKNETIVVDSLKSLIFFGLKINKKNKNFKFDDVLIQYNINNAFEELIQLDKFVWTDIVSEIKLNTIESELINVPITNSIMTMRIIIKSMESYFIETFQIEFQ